MANSGQHPNNYLNYFGADATPLLNFYIAQKQQELLKDYAMHANVVITHHNRALAQNKLQTTTDPPESTNQPPPKPTKVLEDEEEFKMFESSLVPCNLHPVKQSNNCRKCKKIKQVRVEKLHEMFKARRERQPEFNYISNEITTTEPIPKKSAQEKALIPGVFQSYGDPIACNMNDLLRTNILNTQYYRELQDLTTCEEVLIQIEYFCKNAETFTLGTNNVPSTLFCCLYRLLMMKLSEAQLLLMLNSVSPYVRATAALYIRFVGKPEELWGRLSPYLLDDQIFAPSSDSEYKITFGEYIEKLLTDLNYYGTRLPRLPILIEKDIRNKAALTSKKRERMNFNRDNYNLFIKGAECYCLSNKDYNWHHGIVLSPDINMQYVKATIISDKEGNRWEEKLDLGSIILVSCIQSNTKDEENVESRKEESKEKHSRHRSKERHSRHRHDRRRRRSRSRSKSRNRSRSKSRSREKRRDRGEKAKIEVVTLASNQEILDKLNDENKKLIEEAFETGQNQILTTKKSEYARRPTSYKSALSLIMPIGTVRKKSRSSSPQRKMIEVKLVSTQRKTKTEELEEKVSKHTAQESAEHYEKMKKIKEKYGDSAAIKGKNEPRENSDIVKFGIKK